MEKQKQQMVCLAFSDILQESISKLGQKKNLFFLQNTFKIHS